MSPHTEQPQLDPRESLLFSTPEKPLYPTHDQATIPTGVIEAATNASLLVSKEDIQETQLIPVFRDESSTEPIAGHREPFVPPNVKADGQADLPPKQHSSLMRLKQAETSSMSGSMSSFGSMASVYSEAGGNGDYDIIGEVLVGVYYKNSQLHVHVERARGLAAANRSGYSNPYIKTYLLPDKAKHTKQKTTVKKKTLDPVYNEILTV